MLINLSNHPAYKIENGKEICIWDEKQVKAASEFGKIVDLQFPNIPPEWDGEQVEILAKEYFERIKSIEKKSGEKPVVHISGEPVFCFLLIQMLLKDCFICVTSTTERIVKEESNVKTTVFEFKQFRKYIIL